MTFRNLSTISFSTLVAVGLAAVRGATACGAAPEQFAPIKEAEMPKGFPDYTPVGQIEVKSYPAYRKASTSGPAEFWTLFQHIKKNKVAMTAPVEMDYGDARAQKYTPRAMSFLYERPDQGAAGTQGSVEVIDVAPMTVVSIGCRGARTTAAIADARRKLLNWLDGMKEGYVVAGPMRIMGYNSPFVPQDKSFFEVQVPVKPVAPPTEAHGREDIKKS